jgi:hypothetical protein
VELMFKMWISYVYVCCLVCSCFHSDKTTLGSSLQPWTNWRCQSTEVHDNLDVKCAQIWCLDHSFDNFIAIFTKLPLFWALQSFTLGQ